MRKILGARRRPHVGSAIATVVGALLIVALPSAGPALAATPPDSAPASTVPSSTVPDPGDTPIEPDDAPPITLPLIPVPIGCTPPPSAYIVFTGEVLDTDYRSARYRIEQIRQGESTPFATDGEIAIRYGIDVQYLEEGETYLVGAVVEPTLGILVSNVTPPVADFGGDEVIGLSETDADCPDYESADATLHLDGTSIDTPMLAPLSDAKSDLAGAVLTPVLLGLLAIFGLAVLRNGGRLLLRTPTKRELRQ